MRHSIASVTEPWRQSAVCTCGAIIPADHARGGYFGVPAWFDDKNDPDGEVWTEHFMSWAEAAGYGGSCEAIDVAGAVCGKPIQAHGSGTHEYEVYPGVSLIDVKRERRDREAAAERVNVEPVERPQSAPNRPVAPMPVPPLFPVAAPRDLDPAVAALSLAGEVDEDMDEDEAYRQAEARDRALGRGFTRELRQRIGVTKHPRKSPSRSPGSRKLETLRRKSRLHPEKMSAADHEYLRQHPYKIEVEGLRALDRLDRIAALRHD